MRAFRLFVGLAVLCVVAGCGDGGAGTGNMGGDMAVGCTVAAHCDDGVFCNGPEQCVARACVAGTVPCAGAICVELSATCESTCSDADFDGHRDVSCGGDDCDDADGNRFPGNVEVCDVNNHDEDCDPRTFGFRDQDMDGYPNIHCCNGDTCGSDCDDLFPGVHPGEAEDSDNDRHTAIGYVGCTGGYPKDDCHDGIDRVYPGAPPQPGQYFCPPNMPPGHYMCAPGFCGLPDATCINMPARTDWDCSGVW